MAQTLAESVIGTYVELVQQQLTDHPYPTEEAYRKQLAYHTLYLFQVLTMDRGTTHGICAHRDNDVGTLGSIPNFVDPTLLQTWKDSLPKPQDELMQQIIDVLPAENPSPVTDSTRQLFADIVRTHLKTHPKARENMAPSPRAYPN